MKRFFSFILLLTGSFLNAAPSGNPAAPAILKGGFFIPSQCWANIRAGYEGDFIIDAQMIQDEEGSGCVDKYSQTTNAGTATLNLLNRLDLYGVFGSTRVCSQWRFKDMADRVRNAKMETSHNFLWAIGGRALLFEWGNWGLGLEGRYSAVHNHLSWVTIDGESASVVGSYLRSRQWEVNLGVSYHIDLFTPYLAVNYLNARTVIEIPSVSLADQGARSDHFKNKIPVGLNLGCTLSTGKYFMLNVEARVINEEAVTISGDFRF